jgi:hypothetical protein
MRWCKPGKIASVWAVRFVFEEGDKGKGDFMARFKIDSNMIPDFELKKTLQGRGEYDPHLLRYRQLTGSHTKYCKVVNR